MIVSGQETESLPDTLFMKSFLAGNYKLMETEGQPFVTTTEGVTLASLKSSWHKKAAIIAVVFIFLAIFLAFVVNALHNMKADQEVRQKLNEALGKNGKKAERG
jgi:hypothetical protein